MQWPIFIPAAGPPLLGLMPASGAGYQPKGKRCGGDDSDEPAREEK